MTTLEQAIAELVEDRLLDVHTALPGRVQTYYPADQTADVLLLLTVHGESIPVLPRIPVAFPRGGGAFVSLPLAAGDFVFVLFAEQDIGVWRARAGAPGTPGDLRRHPFSGGVALPCVYPDARKLADAHATNIVIGFDGGNQVHIKPGGEIATGVENPTKHAAQAEEVLARLNELKSAINGWTPVPNDGGAALKTALSTLFSTWPTSVASPTVRID